ncbi:MAG: PilN domain-containing protein, partial [Fibrobacteres bacterium]|nr:PilN domain-containing protein [Fibrobacterota bacterium]
TFIAVYVNGELCESDELPYGEKLFLENETQYLEEMFKFLICFWENKLLREPVSELIIAGNKEIKEAFQKNGFNVVEKELPFNAVNGFVYAQALNTLEHGKTAVNHNLLVNNKVKQVRLINKAEMLIRHKFIPVGVAAAILLLLVYGAFQLVLSKREQQLGSGSSEYKLLTSIKSQNELYKQQLHDAKKLIKATTERARILGNLAVSTPDNVRLTLLVIEPKSDSLVIEGLSRNSSEIENFYSNLEKTFKDVRLLYSEQSDTKDKLVRFSLSMRAE